MFQVGFRQCLLLNYYFRIPSGSQFTPKATYHTILLRERHCSERFIKIISFIIQENLTRGYYFTAVLVGDSQLIESSDRT